MENFKHQMRETRAQAHRDVEKSKNDTKCARILHTQRLDQTRLAAIHVQNCLQRGEVRTAIQACDQLTQFVSDQLTGNSEVKSTPSSRTNSRCSRSRSASRSKSRKRSTAPHQSVSVNSQLTGSNPPCEHESRQEN